MWSGTTFHHCAPSEFKGQMKWYHLSPWCSFRVRRSDEVVPPFTIVLLQSSKVRWSGTTFHHCTPSEFEGQSDSCSLITCSPLQLLTRHLLTATVAHSSLAHHNNCSLVTCSPQQLLTRDLLITTIALHALQLLFTRHLITTTVAHSSLNHHYN